MSPIIEKELTELARIIAGIQRHSEENDPALDKQLEALDSIFKDFNKKYPKLELKLESSIDDIHIRIYLKESSVKAVFDEAAKIKGLAAIGLNSFDEADLNDSSRFQQLADSIKDRVLLTYALEFGTETIVLEQADGKVELNFEVKSIANPLTPQNMILQMYAEKEQGEQLDVLNRMNQLGFVDIKDDALFEWEDEFYPRMTE